MNDITIIGNSTIDMLFRPVNIEVFKTGSIPVEETRMSFGGDGLNQAINLAKQEVYVELVTKLGNDMAGQNIMKKMEEMGIGTSKVIMRGGLETSINSVLIDENGERYFLTNPKASQRRLNLQDCINGLKNSARIISFASIFVSSDLSVEDMTTVFKMAKSMGKILACDMTKRKNGETFDDIKGMLPYIDYIFPNEEEIALLTGENDPKANAEKLVEAGVGCAVIKCGSKGCIIKTKDEYYEIPAIPDVRCVDSTGAGDAFVSGFLIGVLNDAPVKACGQAGCALAAETISHMGAN